ncbi:MAG: hypothetical protein NW237_13880 [Cyanobacteriota bacterium]|nr:hypothetical protein [Cyanobacteriota bacterium]
MRDKPIAGQYNVVDRDPLDRAMKHVLPWLQGILMKGQAFYNGQAVE